MPCSYGQTTVKKPGCYKLNALNLLCNITARCLLNAVVMKLYLIQFYLFCGILGFLKMTGVFCLSASTLYPIVSEYFDEPCDNQPL